MTLEARIDRLEAALSRLAEAQARTEAALAQLAEAQARTEERVGRLEEGQRELQAVVAQLAEAQARTEQELAALVGEVRVLAVRVDGLLGDSTERRYRERAASYFQQILRRIRLIDHQSLGDLLDDAVDAGRLNSEEKEDVMLTDVVLSGRREGREVYVLAEVSVAVDREDVERAARRSSLLQKATGIPVLAAVAGQRAAEEAIRQARAAGVWCVFDGLVHPP